MAADVEQQRVRAERIEEALEMLLNLHGEKRVREHLCKKHKVSEAAARNYIKSAYKLGGSDLVRSLNSVRMASSVDADEAGARMLALVEKAEKAENYVAAAMAWKAYETNRSRKDKLWHLDKVSPLLGMEARENRAQLVDAVRNGARLLTPEQRRELQDALSEVEEHACASET